MAAAKYKDNKPEMEKKRRSRINESISCLKLLVLGEVRRKNTRISKLDKADILEMAVEYLQKMELADNNIHGLRIPISLPQRPSKVDRYRAGFNACAEEVRQHLADAAEVDIDLRTRIVDHLANFVQNLQWLRRHDILPYDVRSTLNDVSREAMSLPSNQFTPSTKIHFNPPRAWGNTEANIPPMALGSSRGDFIKDNKFQSMNGNEKRYPESHANHSGRTMRSTLERNRSEVKISTASPVPQYDLNKFDKCHQSVRGHVGLPMDFSLMKKKPSNKVNCHPAVGMKDNNYNSTPGPSTRGVGLHPPADSPLTMCVDGSVENDICHNDLLNNDFRTNASQRNQGLHVSPVIVGGPDREQGQDAMWRPW